MSHPPRFSILRQIGWAPFVCFGVAWALSLTEVGRELEWKTLDWRTAYRAIFQGPPDPRIAIVLFEDDTETNMVSWPPDRAYHGTLNKFLAVEKAAVVAWDVIFDASREGEGDAQMGADTRAAMRFGTQVVIATATSSEPVEMLPAADGPTKPITQIEGSVERLFTEQHALLPFPQLRAVAFWGFADAPRASDGIIREVPLLVRYGGAVYPSLALQTLMVYLGATAEKLRVRLGDGIYIEGREGTTRVPVSEKGMFALNYRFDQREDRMDFPTYSYRQMLVQVNEYRVKKTPGAPRPPDIKGKIVFVGQTVTGKADAGPTPLGPYSPLVLVHANIVNNVLAGDYIRRVPGWGVWFTTGLLGATLLLVLREKSVVLVCGSAVLGGVVYVAVAVWSWIAWSAWVPLAWPLLGYVALQFAGIGRRVLQEQRAKQEIRGMFSSYVSPDLVEQLIRSGERPQLGGQQVEITAYFSDIQGFSTFSEKLSPERLVELMNEYLTVCTDIVQGERGTLDKYIGDAVVAMYGAPLPVSDHAYRACASALKVQAALGRLREKWAAEGEKWPAIVSQMRSRIGLNTGRCVVGNMGSRTRFNYTMMGDDVNLAARMESGAKAWGAYVMCTEATRVGCLEAGAKPILFRPLGRIVVKGRAQATPIHEVLGFCDELPDKVLECVDVFTRGLERYYEQDWAGAEALFQASARLEPNQPSTRGIANNPSLVYLDIVAHSRLHPPAPNWDGVYVMKDK